MKKIYKISITSLLVLGIGLFTFNYLKSNADDAIAMDIGNCHETTKSNNPYYECQLNNLFTWSITPNTFRNNNQFNSWSDYDTVGATTIQTLDPNNLTVLTLKAIAFNQEGNGYFQLDDNSWISIDNFKELPKVNVRDAELNPNNSKNKTTNYLNQLNKISIKK